MIHGNVELHNVVEIEEQPGVPGVLLRRVPRAVRDKLRVRGRWTSAMSSGCEVRFVTDHQMCALSLFSIEDGQAVINCGDFFLRKVDLPGGTVKTIQIERPASFDNVKPAALNRSFSHEVFRVGFNRTAVALVNLESYGGTVRPPRESEKPRRRWLAYGSSITHDWFETGHPQVAARMLGVDVLNIGLSGSCCAEPEMADFLATRGDWDFATCELGINMRGHFTTDEFRTRAHYLINRLVDANPDKPIAIINHFPTGASHPVDENQTSTRQREFDQALRDIVAAKKHPKLHLIEGESILDRFDLHMADLVHPSVVGQVRMGMNLAARLAEIVK